MRQCLVTPSYVPTYCNISRFVVVDILLPVEQFYFILSDIALMYSTAQF